MTTLPRLWPAIAAWSVGLALSVVIAHPGSALGAEPGEAVTCEDMIALGERQYEIPDRLLLAIGKSEAFDTTTKRISPWALDIAGRPFWPTSRSQSLEMIRTALRNGIDNIDIGCTQVNWHWHGWRFDSPDQLLDPKINATYRAWDLKSIQEKTHSWVKAVKIAHAPISMPGEQYRYVCIVLRNYVAVRDPAPSVSTAVDDNCPR